MGVRREQKLLAKTLHVLSEVSMYDSVFGTVCAVKIG